MTPFTEEQIKFIASQTRAAAIETARRVRNQALVGFLILLVGLLLSFNIEHEHNADSRDAIVDSGRVVSVSGCNRDYVTIDALRDQLEDSLDRIDALEARGVYTPEQAQAGRESTREFLRKYKLPDCREAETLLTADPDKPLEVPTPRWPNDAEQLDSEAQELLDKQGGRDYGNP